MGKMRDLLEAHSKNELDIEAIAKPLYEKRNELVKQLLPLFIKRNPEGIVDGLLQSPISVKFKDGRIWKLQPNYVNKEGQFRGDVGKTFYV